MAEMTVRIEGTVPTTGSVTVTGDVIVEPIPTPPAGADILSGTVTGSGTIITIPSGRVWYGFVEAAATVVTANTVASVSVNTTGTGTVPDATVNLAPVRLAVGATNAGNVAHIQTPYFFVRGGGAGANTLTATTATTGTSTFTITAYGYLVPV
jgi:hypothetical protein